MTRKYLESRGWRKIGSRRNGYGVTHYWDHLDHQPERRGCFTTTDAIRHQKDSDSSGCDCIQVRQLRMVR